MITHGDRPTNNLNISSSSSSCVIHAVVCLNDLAVTVTTQASEYGGPVHCGIEKKKNQVANKLVGH